MTIDRSADRPVYQQIADLLREQITTGQLGPGQALPSESYLMQRHDVNRITVRRAIGVLRGEGLIVTVTGAGSFVRAAGEVETVRLRPGDRVEARMPTPDERRTLRVAEGVPVFVITRSGKQPQVLPADRTVIKG